MRILAVLVIAISVFGLSSADVPATFSYQGILTDSLGEPVEDDIYAIQFRIYGDSVATTALWESNGFIPKQTSNGLFGHILGSTNPLPDSLSRYDNLWVGITVDLDNEMTPRTPLTTVPFALSSQYADTATSSLDKTVDAGELVTGVLDTARYSAYEDLVSEVKIGAGSDQVAAGNHEHFYDLSGVMHRIENSDLQEIIINPPFGSMILKSLTIPPGKIDDYFRITYPVNLSGYDGNYILTVQIDSITLFHDNYALHTPGQYHFSYSIKCMRSTMSEWIFWELRTGGTAWADINPFGGFTIDVILFHAGGMASPLNITIGNLIVEYDVD